MSLANRKSSSQKVCSFSIESLTDVHFQVNLELVSGLKKYICDVNFLRQFLGINKSTESKTYSCWHILEQLETAVEPKKSYCVGGP